jgi:hypothetical protein
MPAIGMTKDEVKKLSDKFTPAARKQKVTKTTGNLIGTEGFAPGPNMPGGLSPQKWRSMENRYQGQVERGAPYSREWYDETSRDLHNLTGRNVPRSDKIAQAIGETSAGTPVDANTGHAIKGWNQFMSGDPVATGMYPTRMGQGVEQAMLGAGTTGFKRSPFAGGLSVEWRPNQHLRPVNDIHNTAAFGVYEPGTKQRWRKGLNPAQHRLLDRSVTNVRNRVNTKAASLLDDAQMSGALEGEAASMMRPGFTDYQVQSSAWAPERFDSLGIPMEEAAQHYGDYLNKHQGIITREWAPAPNSDMLPEYHKLPPELKQRFANRLEAQVLGKAETDRVLTDTGGLSGRTFPNAGVYEQYSEPGFVSPIPLGKETGGLGVDESSRKLADASAATYGLLMPQKQVAWNMGIGKANKNTAGMARLTSPDVWSMGENVGQRPLPPSLLRDVQQDFKARGLEPPMADMTGARSLLFNPSVPEARDAARQEMEMLGMLGNAADPRSSRAVELATRDRKEMDKGIKAVAKKYGLGVEYQGRDGNLLPFDAPEKWTSEPFIAAVERAGINDKGLTPYGQNWNKNMPATAARVEREVQALSKDMGLTVPPWYGKLMEAMKSGDAIGTLRKYRNAGIIPAAVFSALGLEQVMEGGAGGAQ